MLEMFFDERWELDAWLAKVVEWSQNLVVVWWNIVCAANLKSGLPFSYWLWQPLPSHYPVMCSFFFVFWPSHGEISVVTMVVDNGLSWFMIALIVTIMTMTFSGQNWSLSILGAGFPQLDKVWTWTGKGLCPCKTPQRAGLKSHNSWDYHWLSSSLSLLLSLS